MGNRKKNTNDPKTKTFFRIVGFVKPFLRLFFSAILLNTLFSMFTAISITIIKPIIQIIFNQDIAIVGQIPNASFFENLKNNFFDYITLSVLVKGDQISTLVNLSILIVSIFILKNVFKYWSTIVNEKFQEGIIKHIRDMLFTKMTSLSVDFFSKRKGGSLISVITNDINVLSNTIIIPFTGMLRDFIQIILFMFLLLTISPYLTFIAFSTSIISLVVLRAALKYIRRYALRMQAAMSDYTSVLDETISGMRVVKAYNAEDTANKKFLDQTARYLKSAVKHKKVIALVPSVNEIFAIAALCVVLFVGGSQVLDGSMKADDLMLFLFTLFAIMTPITTEANKLSLIQRGIVAAERFFDVMDQEPTVKSGSKDVRELKSDISVSNVSFSYGNDTVTRDVDFKIEKGKIIAFVGPSGSGKSTMLDLIIRFYDPQHGSIQLDGTDIRDYDLRHYRNLFGIVAQDTILFNDTVANNITFGTQASQQDIERAARMANAYEFISNLPEGFDTTVGDRGVMLSGGERQRVAIARALLRNPEILVFDEATSSLDSQSEKIVQQAINKSLENKTAVLVAHRLATVVNADEILVFDKGRIAERGTHKQLLAMNGIYRKLYDIQYASDELARED